MRNRQRSQTRKKSKTIADSVTIQDDPRPNKKRMNFLKAFIAFLLVGGGILGGFYFSNNSGSDDDDAATAKSPKDEPIPPPLSSINTNLILNEYYHDPNAFTQGLLYDDGYLIESTGQFGESYIRQVEISSGKVLQQFQLPNEVFGEGIVRWKDTYIMLTWRSKRAFVVRRNDLSLMKEMTFDTSTGEGWGITNDESNLIVSDGSDLIMFWDPVTLREVRRIQVTYLGRPVKMINELEFINGEIVANVWFQHHLFRIDPTNGTVLGIVDCSLLKARANYPNVPDAVLNGIAFDSQTKELYLTGKLWDTLFRVNSPF